MHNRKQNGNIKSGLSSELGRNARRQVCLHPGDTLFKKSLFHAVWFIVKFMIATLCKHKAAVHKSNIAITYSVNIYILVPCRQPLV
jgi:hypothetical protein